MKKILIDAFVPYIGDIFDGVARTEVIQPEDFTPEAVADADALIVRTRTRCDAPLLEGSAVTFVGTATIGTDHFNLPWLASRGIEAVNAPGCNAPAVAQYVLASIYALVPEPEGLTVGVVGVGHVGRIVARWCEALGMNVLCCDPPRAEAEGPAGFVALDEIARRADIITFHTPHTKAPAPYPSHHLADEAFFASLQRTPLIINAARGPVVDNAALLRAMDAKRVSGCVIDCWEGEPAVSPELLARADIATPHIAGYSRQGKMRATQAVVNALLRHLGSEKVMALGVPAPDAPAPSKEAVTASYNPFDDMAAMRAAALPADSAGGYPVLPPEVFERLRNHYSLREEVGA